MNVNDTDIVYSILKNYGYKLTENGEMADLRFLMTCTIRDKPERVVWSALDRIKNQNQKNNHNQIVGVLGCMAERVRDNFGNKCDIICGPDGYKSLPFLVADIVANGNRAFNVELSNDETYSDILPDEKGSYNSNSVDCKTSFLSIMRGCNNMCTFCIVPFVRGRERSKSVESILKEVQHVSNQGKSEVTLLGQNVNSYRDSKAKPTLVLNSGSADGFKTVYKENLEGVDFGDLLRQVATVDPNLLIRFTSPHPKDFNDSCLQAIKDHKNISRWLHFPLQSGSSKVLNAMRRGYSIESYDALYNKISETLNDNRGVGYTTDMISGFCGESEEDHQLSLDAVKKYRYSQVFAFAYSERPGSPASRSLLDDVENSVKKRRLNEIIALHTKIQNDIASEQVGKTILVSPVRKDKNSKIYGYSDHFHKVFFDSEDIELGRYYKVDVLESRNRTLFGKVINESSIDKFY